MIKTFLRINPVTIFAGSIKTYSQLKTTKLFRIIENMPKEKKHVMELQKQRKKIKEKSTKYSPGRITLQVLGTGAKGAPKSLYVFTDQSRYLFNCGEGTQRLAHEHKVKLSSLEHIFVTHKSWKNMGGLPGTALTIQDVGVPQITLHGPKGLEELFVATKRFVILKDLKIEMADCKTSTEFQDNVMKISYVPIKKGFEERTKEENVGVPEKNVENVKNISELTSPKSPHNLQNYSFEVVEDKTDYYAHERKAPVYNFKYSRSRSVSASGRRNLSIKTDCSREMYLNDIKDDHSAMSYICKIRPRPGALNLHKCVELGVQAGPLFGKLKSGEDITLPSGVVVKSKDVCDPDDPGPVFIVVDCPSEAYLESLLTNSTFQKHQNDATKIEDKAHLIVHFTPQNIIENNRYQHWMSLFPSSTHHLILNEQNTCMGSSAVHRVQYKLNLLHNEIFPLLGDKGSQLENDELEHVSKKMKTESDSTSVCSKNESNNSQCSTINNIFYVNTFFNFHLRPKTGIDRSSELKLAPLEYLEEPIKVEGFADELKTLKANIAEKLGSMRVHRKYPRFLFLGTGSCIPNKTRNTSGILYEASDNTLILMDCGEGTYGQLVRFYGPDKVDDILVKIKAIFISHLHADHHIGLIALLQGRRKAMNRLNKHIVTPLLLLAPKQILAWLNFYDTYFEPICQEFELIPNGDLMYDEQTIFEGTKVRLFLTLEMLDINTALVRHCPNAFGIAFNHKNGYKICYSGDTMPSENLINIGQNCDLLIHEATMEDDLENEAVIKMHSTTSQAIEVGANMNARHVLLTHFSQRYAKIPLFNENFGNNVGIAFDNMQVSLDELPLMPLFYPALKLMFSEHYEELENKAHNRLKRQKLMDRLKASNESINVESSVANRSIESR